MAGKQGRLGNWLLVVASVLLTYLAFEFLVFPHMVRHLSLAKQAYLEKDTRILAQPSKPGTMPREGYIAITGDSNALGSGDWLITADPETNAPHHSADVIHERTGRDVITLGRGGTGSVKGLVVETVAKYESLDGLWLYHLPRPGTLLLYFYEGNDLDDNIFRVNKNFPPFADMASIRDPEVFQRFLAYMVQRGQSPAPFLNNFIFARFLGKAIVYTVKDWVEPAWDSLMGDEPTPAANESELPRNTAIISGERVELAPYMQSPALDLTDEQTDLGLYVFGQCARYVRDYFPDADVRVVYIPSPLSCYELAGDQVTIQSYNSDQLVHAVAEVRAKSDGIANEAQRITKDLGLGWIDPRAELRAAAATAPIHGPNDWKHLNRRGYTALGDAIARRLH